MYNVRTYGARDSYDPLKYLRNGDDDDNNNNIIIIRSAARRVQSTIRKYAYYCISRSAQRVYRKCFVILYIYFFFTGMENVGERLIHKTMPVLTVTRVFCARTRVANLQPIDLVRR
jgi:hypothetical protein